MNANRQNQSNDPNQKQPQPESLDGDNNFYEEYDDCYEDEDLTYPPGEAYQAYLEYPTHQNAIDAAEEIWGIPDPRLIED
ncbi:hypothetical protein [Microcoleus sp.]|uniref:hypothetical protein n=1 Tax=Microcoleus sp. TaxID=44472 RepID=UPI003593545D